MIELAVAISLIGILLYSSTLLTNFSGLFFRRIKTASIYQYQVAPIDLLQRTQVKLCRYSVYADQSTALSNLPVNRIPNGPVLRCDRYDGNGWFLLRWEAATNTLWLNTGDSGSPSTVLQSYPFATLHQLTFDVSLGSLQTSIQIRAPMDYTLQSPNPSQPVTIDYVLFTSNQF